MYENELILSIILINRFAKSHELLCSFTWNFFILGKAIENFYNDGKKMRAIHLTESYSGQGRKYAEVAKLKYMVVQKYETDYQSKRL